jgi:hypothetical protein
MIHNHRAADVAFIFADIVIIISAVRYFLYRRRNTTDPYRVKLEIGAGMLLLISAILFITQ